MIKPIETMYAGCRFRSRLEARWAVFFDALNINWEYEKEGYDLGELGYYLPDFWLPQVNMWAEVKPTKFTESEKQKTIALYEGTHFHVLMLEGLPENRPYCAMEKVVYIEPHENKTPEYQEVEYCLTREDGHDYPLTENRFYCSPGSKEDGEFEDTKRAAIIARSARFEYGESG